MKPGLFTRTVFASVAGILVFLLMPVLGYSQPANDNCANAVLLTSGTTCSNTAGSLRNNATGVGATPTTGISAFCGNTTSPDVWYYFVAQTAYPVITLSGMGSNMDNAPRLQLFNTSSCTVATLNANSLACVSGTNTTTLSLNTATTPGGAGLTVGATYLIRAFTNGTSVATGSSATWNFNICVTDQTPATTDYGKSYINITKGSNGGTVDIGDILEVRATFVVRSKSVDSLAYYDTLKSGSGIALVPGTISTQTNEGIVYKSFGDNFADGDAGWRIQTGSDTAIQINMGPTASNVARGALANNSRPSFYNSTCIIMATYRVQVYATYGNKINFGGGAFRFRDKATGMFTTVAFPADSLIVYSSPGLCQDAVSVSNIVGAEFNGTFGVPTGPPLMRSRGTSSFVPGYTYDDFTATTWPDDYEYGVVNNTSKNYTILNDWAKPDGSSPQKRVHGLWDIIGDHTGATNQNMGNPPCDTTQPVSASNPCGYMLVINSSFKTDYAFNYTASNLCPSTYYEVSAWVRNICSKCGCDSTGKGSGSAGYIPSGVNDSSGVKPNLAFKINGIDYYTTGNIDYTGTASGGLDSNNIWVKKGFTYITGPSETSFTLTIRNNAPGGGGNDWALDDISVVTCMPEMNYSPSENPTVCRLNAFNIFDTVRSFFNNYVYYKWQRSEDGGANWTDVTTAQGPATPTWNGTDWEYWTFFSISPYDADTTNNGDLYRVVAATTPGNLNNGDCIFTDGIAYLTLNVLDCGVPLKTDVLNFNGKLVVDKANLSWTTSKEDEPLLYNIERSLDGISFTQAGEINGYNNNGAFNQYSFIDPVAVSGKVYYRVVVVSPTGNKKYSRIIQLSTAGKNSFALGNVINPFQETIDFDVNTTEDVKIEVELLDIFGRSVRRKMYSIYTGVNALNMPGTGSLPAGTYILRVRNNDQILTRKILKKGL